GLRPPGVRCKLAVRSLAPSSTHPRAPARDALVGAPCRVAGRVQMYDLIVRGGRLYDGSGLPAFTADVAVRDGRIAAIGRVDEAAHRTVDADGLAVAPGFIDPHTHLDAQLFWDPLGSSSHEHGVTTVV